MPGDLLELLLELGRVGRTGVVMPKGPLLVSNGKHVLAKAQRRRALHAPVHQHLLRHEVPKLDPAVRGGERHDVGLLLSPALDQTQVSEAAGNFAQLLCDILRVRHVLVVHAIPASENHGV